MRGYGGLKGSVRRGSISIGGKMNGIASTSGRERRGVA